MYDKWIPSVTDIVTITWKELRSVWVKKELDLEKNKKKEDKYGGFQYIIDAINFTFWHCMSYSEAWYKIYALDNILLWGFH